MRGQCLVFKVKTNGLARFFPANSNQVLLRITMLQMVHVIVPLLLRWFCLGFHAKPLGSRFTKVDLPMGHFPGTNVKIF
jgi:hypothetical protein